MEGFVLGIKPCGESGWLLSLFSKETGRVKGFIQGSKKRLKDLQVGNSVQFERKRRLESQLGTFVCEVTTHRVSKLFDSYAALQTVQYVAEVLEIALPEEHAYPGFYSVTIDFLDYLTQPNLWERLAFWELQLLATLGYGLSIREEEAVPCDAGSPLSFVSPKTGRAVSAEMGAPYAEKLLPLPAIFGGPTVDETQDRANAFKLTGFFLEKALHGKALTKRHELVHILSS